MAAELNEKGNQDMNRADKERFVRELAETVTKQIIAKIPDLPMNWDGHELRLYMADKFAAQATLNKRDDTKRLREYRNDVLVRNL